MSHRTPNHARRLAAFWFADIVGYTALAASDDTAALAAVDALHLAGREEVESAGGRVVKVSGDAVLAEFPSSEAALRSAIALRDRLQDRMALHVGVHAGEVSDREGDLYGDGVNIAARLQTRAEAGQVLASEDVYRQVRAIPTFRFEPVGPLELKGLPAPMPAYAVEFAAVVEGGAPDEQAADPVRVPPRGGAAGPDRRPSNRLIVAPFRMLRADDETAFLSFSLADAVSFSLSNLESIVVRSSGVAGAAPVDASFDPRDVARRSDVDLVVTGTLLRVGQRLQVTAELNERDGTRLGAFRTQAGLGDIFELQEEMTTRIVDALALKLTARERQLMHHDVPATSHSYELYLRATELGHRASDWHAARDLFQAALDEDPGYAPAWAQLGRCHRLIAKYGPGEERVQGFQDAETALGRALEINPDLDLAHAYSAQLETELGRAGEAMLRLLGRLEARPRGVDLLSGLVQVLRYCGLLDESVRAHEAARAIDPGARTSLAYTLFLMGDFLGSTRVGTASDTLVHTEAFLALGRVDDARAALRTVRDGFPGHEAFWTPTEFLIQGDIDRMVEVGTAAYSDFPDPEGRYFFARLLARGGRTDLALDFLEDLAPQYAPLPPPGLDPWFEDIDRTDRYRALLDQVQARRETFRAGFLAAAATLR